MTELPTNRLSGEKSPYLLQHAHNPVDWYPWGEEAFARARERDLPIFLSIGYSTCHWCHVMERESFEDEEVAAALNATCVAIKVDREERPDLDQVYMAVCQALTGSGGWPLNLFLTPDREPFFAATYLPKHSRGGRLGLIELAAQVGRLWQEEQGRVRDSAERIREAVGRTPAPRDTAAEPSAGWFAEAVQWLRGEFDPRWGGFGSAPKFPTPHQLTFLLTRHRRDGAERTLQMVTETLEAMRRGGLWDHLGGGFHRYSTDHRWLLPHFEKMLYDQAGLIIAYAEAHRATGDARFAAVARDTIGYVLRDLADPEGGFYSAEDADSEGEEGRFYVWRREEIDAALGPEDAERFCAAYGVTAEGNLVDEATRRRTGANVLHLPEAVSEEDESSLEVLRDKLLQLRNQRVRPHRDDKIITAWNGMMISALSRAAAALDEPSYARRAERCAGFVLSTLRAGDRLLRRYRDGDTAIHGFAEDYAFLALGLLDLHRATGDLASLLQARQLAGQLAEGFWDPERGGLFDTAADAEVLVFRPRSAYDGATPSANSAALEVFARLGLLTGDPAWTDRAWATARAFAAEVSAHPAGFTQFLQGVALLLEPTREVVVAGSAGAADTLALLRAATRPYAPETSVLLADPDRAELAELGGFVGEMVPQGGRAAAYVCENQACRAPLARPAELGEIVRTPPQN